MANRPRVIVIERMDPLGPELLKREADLVELYDRPGETLELRHFALPDLVARLQAAGFCDVRVRREPNFAHGIWWPGADGWPITARRPAA